jgi:hypothetical protein
MHMPSRTAKFVSAAFASILAGVPLTTASNSAAPATDNCLSGPKNQAPQGSHWYYRIEHATQRHCWYLKDESEKLSQAVAPNSPKAEPAMQHSIANAHAELTSPPVRIEQATSAATAQPAPANAAGMENGQPAAPPDANTQLSAVASRWPEPSNMVSSANPGSAAGNSGAAVQSSSKATRLPAVAAVTLAAADSSSAKQSGAAHMLLIVILGALSIAGLIGSAVLRFGGTRPVGRRDMRGDPRAADDPSRRIAEMMARLSRTAAT